jgi:primosomal protein N'
MDYPPYKDLVNIMILSQDKQNAQKHARWMAAEIRQDTNDYNVKMVGPGPAIQEKAKRLFRYQIVLKFNAVDQMEIKGIIRNISEKINDSGVYINIDVDPISLI